MTNIRKLIKTKPEDVVVLHYGSSSIYSSPVVITCITLVDFATGQQRSFSLAAGDERQLLQDFLAHVQGLQGKKFVGWNLADTTYGIQVIERRCREVLNVPTFPISTADVLDLDEELGREYGKKYCPHPKLRKLAEHNDIGLLDFVNGKDEVDLYTAGRYREIELSTNRKAWIINEFLELYRAGKLKIPRQSRIAKVGAFLEEPLLQSINGILGLLLTIVSFVPAEQLDPYRRALLIAGLVGLALLALAVTRRKLR